MSVGNLIIFIPLGLVTSRMGHTPRLIGSERQEGGTRTNTSDDDYIDSHGSLPSFASLRAKHHDTLRHDASSLHTFLLARHVACRVSQAAL